ncbi:hypothetical protein B0T17DRAFT_498569 [Bombardia bombarda]|uniref:Mucin n=1 Tax=Bombardia bombarda TaxID=252184 RepID=A0AA39TMR6_9PEZI|nr:hypothetical protein B0T17DRAFT_498569 [Bombardia bombarda]
MAPRLLPRSILEARTTLEPLDLPLALDPPGPRTTIRCTRSDFSLKLPLFTNTTTDSTASISSFGQDPSSYHIPYNHNLIPPNAPPASPIAPDEPLPLSQPYTFFISPSTSASSLAASSTWSSSITTCPSRETQTTMPGQTPVVPAEGVFASNAPVDHVTNANCTSPPNRSLDTSQRQPRSSTASGKSEGSASPIFTRWARRHQHHHTHTGRLQHHFDVSARSSSESKTKNNDSPAHKRSSRSRPGSLKTGQPPCGVVPQMTQDEFEALPLAIQRKYFSTLERLRFARDSGLVDGISQHYNDISNYKRRRPRQDQSISEQIAGRNRRRSLLEPQFSSPEPSPSHIGLPDTIGQRRELTREEQVILARRLRASVILDAADEAIYKINRQASRTPTLDAEPVVTSQRSSMDSNDGIRSHPGQRNDRDVPQSFYESFRWLEEEEDLDLRLFLDDYHANLRDNLPSPKQQQRPSFRRHLSISRIPFSRNSVALSRPATKDANSPTSPGYSPTGSASMPFVQTRRKSRALSLLTPKHVPDESFDAFDPSAAHYQDPEARLKLRVYLASPQKFDEAIEFGFPSADVLSGAPILNATRAVAHRRQSRQNLSAGSSNMHAFLADYDEDDDEDDGDSINSDQVSTADPESPKTPQTFENKAVPQPVRPMRVVSPDPLFLRDGGNSGLEGAGYAQVPASSREMTLRMTLTRPDLRAREDQIYGWQQSQGHQQTGRKSTTLAPLGMETNATHIGDGTSHKDSMEKMSASFDHWNVNTVDKGVMKRIWNRVRRA